MTARHQIRVGGRRLGRDRSPIDATPAPPLGELLRVARERKGVDIYRAERDTKIRAKHLDALENGDYTALPGAVYIKGFLRNYATYLGLDGDEVIERWRDETMPSRRNEAVAVAPPRPIAEPRRGLTFTRGVVFAAIFTLIIGAFVAYLGAQVLRFNQTVAFEVAGPQLVELAPGTETHTFRGTTVATATVSVHGAEDFLATTEADANGAWSVDVPVGPGQNDFSISVRDPQTGRDSAPHGVVVLVPVPPSEPPPATGSSPTPGVPATALSVLAPAEGASVTGETVTVSGTTDGTRVVITATYLGEAPSPDPTSTPAPTPTPDPLTSPEPEPTPTAPEPVDVTVTDGTFTAELPLPPGQWRISVTGSATARADAVVERIVTVSFDGVVVIVEIKNADAYLVAYQDGRRVRGTGRIYAPGDTLTLIGSESVQVRTGNSGATRFTVNGELLGRLGAAGAVEEWIFEKGQPPRRL